MKNAVMRIFMKNAVIMKIFMKIFMRIFMKNVIYNYKHL